MITVTFTQGRISIRRDRVSRAYTPTTASRYRLYNLVDRHNPCDRRVTQRSVIYTWHGLTTLSGVQRKILARTLDAYSRVTSLVGENKYYTPEYAYYSACRDCAIIAGIDYRLIQ